MTTLGKEPEAQSFWIYLLIICLFVTNFFFFFFTNKEKTEKIISHVSSWKCSTVQDGIRWVPRWKPRGNYPNVYTKFTRESQIPLQQFLVSLYCYCALMLKEQIWFLCEYMLFGSLRMFYTVGQNF